MNKFGRVEGVYGIHTAPIQDSIDGYIPKANRRVTETASVSSAVTANANYGWYNDKIQVMRNTEGQTVVTVEGRDCPGEIAAMMLGKKFNPSRGLLFDDGSLAEAPYFATSFHAVHEAGVIFEQYLKGKWSISGKEISTAKEDIDPKNIQLVYTAITTDYEFDLQAAGAQKYDFDTDALANVASGTKAGLKRITKEVTKEDFAAAQAAWYANVQVPGAASAPALTMTSVPDQDDTGVAVDAPIVLTFSNAISTAVTALTVIGEGVAASMTYNGTRKIVTVTPTEDMTESAEYTFAVVATDVYGQKATKSFTFTITS